MTFYKAHVRNGRLVLDEPVDLPEGSEVLLIHAEAFSEDGAPELTEDERRRLEAALGAGMEDERAGRLHDAADVLRQMRKKRGR